MRFAVHLATETELGVFFSAYDPGFGLAQRREHLLAIVSDGGNNAHAGDDHTSHAQNLFAPPGKRARKYIEIKD
jgi:hypothetical protein